ncbi:MAG: flagellar motor switch protein [Sulfitobacter sp.]
MAMIIDSVIILLLIGSITYGYVVSRKVRLLMGILKDLEPLVEAFSSAVDKSQDSVNQMRDSIEVVEQAQHTEQEVEPVLPPQTAFASRRATQVETPGLRVMRDKKELVRAFFENQSAAEV